MDLRRKKVLVTGGAVRIGRAICEAMARRGASLVVHCNRSRDEAEELASSLRELGVDVAIVHGELRDADSWERIIDEAYSIFGGLDVLVNNAAIFLKDSYEGVTEAQFEQQVRINLTAPVMLMNRFIQRTGKKSVSVLNLLDRRIVGVDPDCFSYQVSKKMLAEVIRSASLEFWPRVRVNAVAPGAILPPPGNDGSRVKDMAGNIPLGRVGDPEEVAEAAAFLLESDGVSGEVLFVDGGQHLVA